MDSDQILSVDLVVALYEAAMHLYLCRPSVLAVCSLVPEVHMSMLIAVALSNELFRVLVLRLYLFDPLFSFLCLSPSFTVPFFLRPLVSFPPFLILSFFVGFEV